MEFSSSVFYTYLKILLGYLPLDRTKWQQTLINQRKNYLGFIQEIILRPGLIADEVEVMDHVSL
jgi:hypothetical protein